MSIQRGKSKVLTLVPDAPMTAAAEAVIYDSEGNVLVAADALTVNPSTVNTTVFGIDSNSRHTFQVLIATGIVPGLSIIVTDPTWGVAVSEVSSIDGDIVRLVEPLPDEPDDGATVQGLDITVTVPPAATGTLGVGYVLEVTEGDESVRTDFAVVRYPFAGPCKAQHIREKISRGFAGEFLKDETFHRRVAVTVNDEIETRIMASGKYLDRFWSPKSLAPLRDAMIPLVLSLKFGLREGGSSRDEFNDAAEKTVEARLQDVLRSVNVYDANGDGSVDSEEKSAARRWSMEFIQ